MRLKLGLVALILLACALGSSLLTPNRRIDYGRWRVVVLQCDDFGFEGWVPDPLIAERLPLLTQELAPPLRAYARSTLESAADIDSLVALLQSHVDLDGLPPVLQANTIVGAAELVAPTGAAEPPGFGFRLRPSGAETGAYGRPGLWQAVARAESAGVWRAELHGLTHFDLEWLRRAHDRADSFTLRALSLGVHAAVGMGRRAELGSNDPLRARAINAAAAALFERRFDRQPLSVMAPDYRWGRADEVAWQDLGIRVVQAKSEQIDPSLQPGRAIGRLRKRLRAVWERRRGGLLYLDRAAALEPYGNPDVGCAQGAEDALQRIQRAWSRGEPAVVAMHRLQWIHSDPALPRAMRLQFDALMRQLEGAGGARFLVDAEVEQLERQGWSVLPRGSHWVVRNFTARALRIALPDRPAALTVSTGTTLLGRREPG